MDVNKLKDTAGNASQPVPEPDPMQKTSQDVSWPDKPLEVDASWDHLEDVPRGEPSINWAGHGDLDVRYQERLFWQRVYMESLMSYHLDKGCAHPGDSELARNDANKAVKSMRETCPLPGSPEKEES